MLQPIAPHVRTVRKMAGRGSYEILSLAESVNVFCSNLKRLRSCLSFLIPESFNKCNFHTSNSYTFWPFYGQRPAPLRPSALCFYQYIQNSSII